MKEKYYFRFLFKHITLQNHIQQELQTQTQFQIDLYKSKKLIGRTSNTPCQLDQNGRITLRNQIAKFTTFYQEGQKNLDACQIRLLSIYPGGERLIGRYEFALGNYIRAKKQLNRSCIQMCLQIAQNFKVDYAVYLDTTLEALTQIIQQHQTARNLQILQQDYEQASFLPEQLRKPTFQNSQKEIAFDLSTPVIIKQRYWSPNRAKKQCQKCVIKNQQSQVEGQQENKPSPPSKKKHMIKKFSTLSDNSNNLIMRRQLTQKEKLISSIMQQQVDCLVKQQDPNNGFKQLYEVINSDSKITYTPLVEDQDRSSTIQSQIHFFNLVNKIGLKTIFMVIIFIALLSLTVYDHATRASRKKKPVKGQKLGNKANKT